jgi:ribonucleoside-diphosphate reductase alpha chain
MVKAVALYRDGCKLSQPLNSTSSDLDAELLRIAAMETADASVSVERVQETVRESAFEHAIVASGYRKLPARRHGFTQEADVGGHKVVLKTGEYEDGQIGELQVDMYKEGASFRGLMNSFAASVSIGLQHGVPLGDYVDAFTFTRFEPAGIVMGDPQVKQATSVVDYVFRVLGNEYLGRDELVHVKTRPERPVQTRLVPVKTAVESIAHTAHATNDSVSDAKKQGFTGEACGQCGSMKVKQNGTCHLCIDCGTTSGCS